MAENNSNHLLKTGWQQYWQGFKRTLKPLDVYVWILLGVVGLGLLHYDALLVQMLRVSRHSLPDQMVRMMAWFGEFWVLVWLGLLPAAAFNRPRLTVRTLVGLIALVLIVQGLKMNVGRVRPHPTGSDSFPSGHAATAFFLASLWSMHWRRQRVCFYLWAVAMGGARLCLGRHYPSDVMFGALIGQMAGHFSAVELEEPLLAKPERLNYPAQIVMLVTILCFVVFDDEGFGRLARIFAPAFLILLVWGYTRQRVNIEKWISTKLDTTAEPS